MLRKYTAEALGLFVVMFCGCGSYVYMSELGELGVALAFGLSLAAMTTIFYGISGAHFNPVISLAQFIKGNLSVKDFLGYLAAQLVGAFGAVGMLALVFEGADSGLGANEMVYLTPQLTVVVEAVLTFIFVFAFLAVTSKPKLQPLCGLVVGITLTALYIIGAYTSGPSLNPFRSLAPALLARDVYLIDLWVYLVAPVVGGGLAALAQPWLCGENTNPQ